MQMGWEQLTFVHWAYDPAAVQRLLPPGLTVQTFDDRAWVSLVPFVMRVRFPLVGAVPWLSVFPETNVRTYVTAADGTEGIWFFSLDASRLAAVLAARVGYRLPYMWSSMSVRTEGDHINYDCVRRWPGPRGAHSTVGIRIGAEVAAQQLDERDHFLSARWRLYSSMFGSLWGARALHEPWPLHRASLIRYDDELVTASGLPEPTGDPIVQYSPGVNVRVSMPYRIRHGSPQRS
ncbi:unannotated protein [freshwater metagenome]|uniref:Unannotated protein n=1 Tax=freshwater metagenome TaxID=449393 RepID=A0A6J7E8Q4_9ZZZZ|nr:DUF2071 domain-containing protein [Actinomycetota bacterium]